MDSEIISSNYILNTHWICPKVPALDPIEEEDLDDHDLLEPHCGVKGCWKCGMNSLMARKTMGLSITPTPLPSSPS